MQPDQVKGVEQPATHRVGRMMAESILIIIDDQSCLGVCWNIVVPSLHGAGFIHITEESVDGIADAVGTAESADGSWLF